MSSPRDLARQVLSRPDEFPPEFVSWLTRLVSNNPRISTTAGKSSGTATVLRNLAASWSGVLLTVPGLGPTERVPELTGGSGTWTLTKAYFRCETAGTADTTVVIEKMTPDADSSWATATIVSTLTIPAGHYEISATISVAVTTGDLLRIRFTSIGTSGLFNVSASGTAAGGGGTGGGTATPITRAERIPLDSPDNSGNAISGLTTSNGFINVRRLIPFLKHAGDGYWTGAIRIPDNYSSGGTIVVSSVVNATSGVVRFVVGTSVVDAGSSEDATFTDEAAQNITVPASAFNRFDTTFVLSTVPGVGKTLNVRIKRQASNVADTCTADCGIWHVTFKYTGS